MKRVVLKWQPDSFTDELRAKLPRELVELPAGDYVIERTVRIILTEREMNVIATALEGYTGEGGGLGAEIEAGPESVRVARGLAAALRGRSVAEARGSWGEEVDLTIVARGLQGPA